MTVKSDVYNRDRDYIENRYIYTGIQPEYVFTNFFNFLGDEVTN